jgi:cytochrome c biogenesis protein CcmG/thiol:disulfide interchange protein DsbE
MKPVDVVRLAPLLVMLLISMILASGLWRGDSEPFEENTLIGRDIATFRIPALGGNNAMFSPRDWRGKVVVLNVFASWCEPCVEEHKLWMKIAKEKKLYLYGLAWKDTPAKVSEWLNKHGNPYQMIGVDEYGASTIALALTGVPETFVLDQNGTIYFHYQMPVTDDVLYNLIVPLVDKLTKGEYVPKPAIRDLLSNKRSDEPENAPAEQQPPQPVSAPQDVPATSAPANAQ